MVFQKIDFIITMPKLAKGKKPSKLNLNKLYVRESKSIREAVKILGYFKDIGGYNGIMQMSGAPCLAKRKEREKIYCLY